MLCIYHSNCFDGFGAAWAVRAALGADNVEFFQGIHGQPPPDVTGRDVVIVDFSYKAGVLMHMVRIAASVLVLDHHKTAQEDLKAHYPIQGPEDYKTLINLARMTNPNNPQVLLLMAQFDMERSGAGIAWNFFHEDEPRPTLLNHIEDRDLWRFALSGTRAIQAGLSSYPFDFEVWDSLMNSGYEGIEALAVQGEGIERKHLQDVDSILKVCQRTMIIGGYEVPVCNVPFTMTSDAGNLMAKPGSFAACYWDTPEGRTFSLRSTDEGIDVSEIAKVYGGGGHRNAAGFQTQAGWEGDRELA